MIYVCCPRAKSDTNFTNKTYDLSENIYTFNLQAHPYHAPRDNMITIVILSPPRRLTNRITNIIYLKLFFSPIQRTLVVDTYKTYTTTWTIEKQRDLFDNHLLARAIIWIRFLPSDLNISLRSRLYAHYIGTI